MPAFKHSQQKGVSTEKLGVSNKARRKLVDLAGILCNSSQQKDRIRDRSAHCKTIPMLILATGPRKWKDTIQKAGRKPTSRNNRPLL